MLPQTYIMPYWALPDFVSILVRIVYSRIYSENNLSFI